MAVTTANTILSYYGTSSYQKLVDILSYPDLGGAPNKIDTTTLSETVMKTSILGLMEAPDLTFEANYTDTDYAKVKALEGVTNTFKIDFGDNGADGIFYWTGKIAVYVNGGGVDEARKMTIVCSAETAITDTDPEGE